MARQLPRVDNAARLRVLRESEIDLMTMLVDLVEELTPRLQEYHDTQATLRAVRAEIAELVAAERAS